MRTQTHTQRAKRHRRRAYIRLLTNTAVILMLLFALLLALLFQITPTLATSPFLLVGMGIISAIIGLLAGKRLSNLSAPQEAIERELKGLDNRFTLMHYYLPANHVLFAPSGVYTITPVTVGGRITLDGTTVRAQRSLAERLIDILTGTGIGQPLQTAQRVTEQTRTQIQQTFPDAAPNAIPLIFFTNSTAEVENNSTFQVVYAGSRKPALKAYLRSQANAQSVSSAHLTKLLEQLSAQ